MFWGEPVLQNAESFFFLSGFSSDTDDSQDSREREGSIFYSTLPLPSAHKHWDILQLCMWDDYHVFLIATLVFARLLHDEIYHLIEFSFEWLIDDAMFVCFFDELILGICYSNLTLETGGFEHALTIILVLQTNWLTKCASYRLIYLVPHFIFSIVKVLRTQILHHFLGFIAFRMIQEYFSQTFEISTN